MNKQNYKLLLADDDDDDCSLFQEALDELYVPAKLTTVNDGVQLMDYLSKNYTENQPDILFLDINMPRKNGRECLKEIKEIDDLKNLPVVIFSTSLDIEIVDLMYKEGATYYIRKPGDFSKLKKVIGDALSIITETNSQQPIRENFVLQA
jgi:CheY-like chemotaxis protein